MKLDDIRPHLQAFTDADILALLNEVSNEVKRRNTIMRGVIGGNGEIQKDVVKQAVQTILEVLTKPPK